MQYNKSFVVKNKEIAFYFSHSKHLIEQFCCHCGFLWNLYNWLMVIYEVITSLMFNLTIVVVFDHSSFLIPRNTPNLVYLHCSVIVYVHSVLAACENQQVK